MVTGYELKCALRTNADELRISKLIRILLRDAAPKEGKTQWGWGVNKSVDAFGDGSLTPAGTPYAITTSVGIHALLDYSMRSCSDPKLISEITAVRNTG